MKINELKKLSIEELKSLLKMKQDNYQKLKFDNTISTIKNPLLIKNLRKDIARINTIINNL
ncbi:MAG: 50S ribosomal protein L29 [Candidatus Bostrichicola ureolyticus]|nr:MAG: 50S ribosomal protein L29 [Candidatus Bostrichicola ureolyticus]WGH27328.1 MAG: 50S ribosomal protein L29 [Candidatus Bostrichicola ureolyticus]